MDDFSIFFQKSKIAFLTLQEIANLKIVFLA